MEKLKQFFDWTTLIFIGLVATCIVMCAKIGTAHEMMKNPKPKIEIVEKSAIDKNVQEFYEARTQLAIEVDNYIKAVAPTSKLNALNLIDLCSLYNVDLRLALVQGHVESHFGTKGTAAKTNSVFNVGAYDGHSANRQKRNGFGFRHPDDSVEPYLKLLTSSYLVNGRTENDLLYKFVNVHGMRYASSTNYESALRTRWARIDRYANINQVYINYKQCRSKIGV
jgi:hypothetical protein